MTSERERIYRQSTLRGESVELENFKRFKDISLKI